MANIIVKIELSSTHISSFNNGTNVKPYQNKLNEIVKQLPGSMQFISETCTPLVYGKYSLYEITMSNPWFVKDMTLEATYETSWIDDGAGAKFEITLLSSIKMKQISSASNSIYNYGWSANGTSSNKTCNHIAVDVGFNIKNMQCKHCQKDMN